MICITEGDIIFFNVELNPPQYPRYFKDSILNTNQNFDYGPFEELADLILVQNKTVQSFSFVFKEKGIYVFENAASGTVTVIGVVAESQTCSNVVNGIGAAMVTPESLAAIGIEPQDKQVNPDWWFVILSFVFINCFVFIVIGIFIQAFNNSQNSRGTFFNVNQNPKASAIYYDKIASIE